MVEDGGTLVASEEHEKPIEAFNSQLHIGRRNVTNEHNKRKGPLQIQVNRLVFSLATYNSKPLWVPALACGGI